MKGIFVRAGVERIEKCAAVFEAAEAWVDSPPTGASFPGRPGTARETGG
jgi:hypothetical protein